MPALPALPALLFALLFAWSCAPLAAQTKQPAPGDSKREIQVFDIKDLVDPKAPDFESPGEASGAAEKEAFEQRKRLQAEKNLAALASFIGVFIEPPLENGEEVKSLGKQSLVVLGRPEQQAWVHRFLTMNRKKEPHFLEVEATLVHINDADYKRLLEPILSQQVDKSGKKVGPVHAMLKAGEKTDGFMASLQKCRGTKFVTAPRLMCMPLQRAWMSVANEVAYVKDYKFTRTASPPALIADPVIDVLKDGVIFEGTGGFVSADRIGMSFKLTVAEVHRPIKVVDLPKEKVPADARGGAPLKISLPETTTTSLQAKAEIPAGGCGIFSMGRRHKQHWILVIKVSEIAGR